MVISIVFLILFGLFFKKSSQGIFMRSVADNQKAAFISGRSRPPRFCPVLGDCRNGGLHERHRFGHHQRVNVHDLSAIGLKVFPVVILGGLDSIGGAIIGGIIIGLLKPSRAAIFRRRCAMWSPISCWSSY